MNFMNWQKYHPPAEAEFREPDLAPLGRQIIDCCLDGGSVKDYEALIRAETSICP